MNMKACSKEFKKPISNSLKDFTIFDKEGKKKDYVVRGFLSSHWLTWDELDAHKISLDDGKTYDLICSQLLFQEAAKAGPNAKVKAICSFQQWNEGSFYVFAKLLDRPPVVQVKLTGEELQDAIAKAMGKILEFNRE